MYARKVSQQQVGLLRVTPNTYRKRKERKRCGFPYFSAKNFSARYISSIVQCYKWSCYYHVVSPSRLAVRIVVHSFLLIGSIHLDNCRPMRFSHDDKGISLMFLEQNESRTSASGIESLDWPVARRSTVAQLYTTAGHSSRSRRPGNALGC